MNKLPKRIDPCPIVDATFGINFESDISDENVFDILFEKLKHKYSNKEKLPISSLPNQFRNIEPRLKYEPTHKINNENFVILIGAKTFSISHNGEYKSWDFFYNEIKECISILKNTSIIKEVKRLGLRYIDIFEGIDIFEKIKETISLRSNSTNLRTKITKENFYHLLQITNDSIFLDKNGQEKQGSLLDIDTTLIYYRSNEIDYVEDFLEKAHQKEKELFYGLLKEDFLESFNPVYD